MCKYGKYEYFIINQVNAFVKWHFTAAQGSRFYLIPMAERDEAWDGIRRLPYPVPYFYFA